jgi:hypothetical protein
MSKYRWPIALLVLASALAVALLLPASAMAAKPTATGFTATGLIWIADMGDQKTGGPMGIAKGEEVDILIIDGGGWDALDGAYAGTYHNGTIRYLLPAGGETFGTFQGRLSGKFTMAAYDYTTPEPAPIGTLKGNMIGDVSGTWNVSGPGNPEGTTISDQGTWQSTTGTGVFAKVKARGTWQANLSWGEPPLPGWLSGVKTYWGKVIFAGTYQ